MCRYDLRPLLEHSEPKMASMMAVSVSQQPYGFGWHTYFLFTEGISRPYQKQDPQLLASVVKWLSYQHVCQGSWVQALPFLVY